MIETILEEIRGLNLPLFWLTESEHGKRTTWSFVPDNPCNDIYSVTKVFTVTALGFLYDQGLWKPDDKICDLFRKKLPGRYDPQWEEVTLDHVIRHRIGVTEDFLDIDNYDMTQFGSEDFLKLAFERPVPARPGVDYQYSDGAYYLLSRAIRRPSIGLQARLQAAVWTSLTIRTAATYITGRYGTETVRSPSTANTSSVICLSLVSRHSRL